MFVFEYITPIAMLVGLAAAFAGIAVLIRADAIRNWLDPMLLPLFQTILTAVLLGGRVVPIIDVLFFAGFLLLIAWGRGRPPAMQSSGLRQWQVVVGPLIALSITLNVYLISQKGILLFQDDLGLARQEFYQGWGLVQRVNSICALIFGVHWAMRLAAGRARTTRGLLLLGWTTYLILSLGSKSGLFTLLTCIGCVASFRGIRLNARQALVLVLAVATSVAMMFVLFFNDEAWASLGVRVISYVDGPFYYFRSPTPPVVSWSYPFDQLLQALRVNQSLPESSLGPAINLDYFGFDNELFGPNPQIFVEAHAIFGALWPFYYLVVAAAMVAILRSARTPYGLALLASIAGPLIIDSQFAMSNALNVALAYLLKLGFSALPRFRIRHESGHALSRIPRV